MVKAILKADFHSNDDFDFDFPSDVAGGNAAELDGGTGCISRPVIQVVFQGII